MSGRLLMVLSVLFVAGCDIELLGEGVADGLGIGFVATENRTADGQWEITGNQGTHFCLTMAFDRATEFLDDCGEVDSLESSELLITDGVHVLITFIVMDDGEYSLHATEASADSYDVVISTSMNGVIHNETGLMERIR